jgi:CheY-like chemotaxis protein
MKKIDIACIIDDDPIFVFATKRMMELTNFCNGFLIYNNGQEAINQLRPIIESGKAPDIILLDLNMPIMDGWEFLDEFSTIQSSKPITIYIVSSSIDPADMLRAHEYDTIGNYYVKPISQDDLLEILNNSAEMER